MSTATFLMRWALLLGTLAAALGNGAIAQDTNFLRYLMKDHLDFEVHVTDEHGRALVGAMLWLNETDPGLVRSDAADLAASKRFASRYSKSVDFLINLDLPAFTFQRLNTEGIYRSKREYRSSGNSGGYPYILIATKRGYLPQVVEGVAQLNRHVRLDIKLPVDPQSPTADPRMARFDEIMALARTALPGEEMMGEPRMHRLQDLEKELRTLAQALERDGKNDDASAAYWALAEFPEVTNMTLPDGSTRIVGYANSKSGPAAEADRTKATILNRSVPKLLIGQNLIARGFPREGIRNAEQGLAYLDAFNAIRNSPLGERLTPSSYRSAIYQAISYGSVEGACALLQDAYRFEPFIMPLKDWWGRIADIDKKRERAGLPSHGCVIAGLPAFGGKN